MEKVLKICLCVEVNNVVPIHFHDNNVLFCSNRPLPCRAILAGTALTLKKL